LSPSVGGFIAEESQMNGAEENHRAVMIGVREGRQGKKEQHSQGKKARWAGHWWDVAEAKKKGPGRILGAFNASSHESRKRERTKRGSYYVYAKGGGGRDRGVFPTLTKLKIPLWMIWACIKKKKPGHRGGGDWAR